MSHITDHIKEVDLYLMRLETTAQIAICKLTYKRGRSLPIFI